MRLYEFADAEAQLALLRTIIDNTWTAIAQQAEQQKRVDAERNAQAMLKPHAKKSSKGTSRRIPTPKPPPPKQPQAPLAKQLPPPLSNPNPKSIIAVKPLPPTNPQLKQQPTSTPIYPKFSTTLRPKPPAISQKIPQTNLKTGYFGKNSDVLRNQ